MDKNKLSLIATDLDNTLLNEHSEITEYTKEIFKKCKQTGILTAFATARNLQTTLECANILKPDALVVCNGSLVLYQGETIFESLLPLETVHGLIEEIKKEPSTRFIMVDSKEGKLWNNKDIIPNSKQFFYSIYEDFSKPLSQDIFRVQTEMKNRELAEELALRYHCNLTCFHGLDWYQFTPKNINKAFGLTQLVNHLQLDFSQIAAFGDDYSDIEMLRICGFGTAVENAIKEVKEAAAYVTESNKEDGVARFLSKFLLEGDETYLTASTPFCT